MESLRAAIDELASIAPDVLAEPGTLLDMQRELSRLEAVVCRAAASFEARGEWRADRARSATAWLAWKLRMPKAAARRQLVAGRAMDDAPLVGDAWLRGDITASHVLRLAGVRSDRTADAFARDETMLLDHATSLSYGEFVRTTDYWKSFADPDGAEDAAAKVLCDRYAFFSQTFDGVFKGDQQLDAIGGAIVSNELKRLEHNLFEADWKEAKARLGRTPAMHELGRTAMQRRADALVEMAIRSATAPPDGRRPEPLFTVFCGYETFAGPLLELAGGTVVTPGQLAPYLDRAWVERVVFDGPSRVIDVGVRRRLFSGATRRAVEVRDRECFDRTCDERDHLQIDHVVPYRDGGLTVEGNGRAACGFHNRSRNHLSSGVGVGGHAVRDGPDP